MTVFTDKERYQKKLMLEALGDSWALSPLKTPVPLTSARKSNRPAPAVCGSSHSIRRKAAMRPRRSALAIPS
jgi:hypothetical protein